MDARFLKNYYSNDDSQGKETVNDVAKRSLHGTPLFNSKDNNESNVMRRRILETSWSYQYAPYPFLHSKEKVVVFLGQIYLLGEGLVPLLVNLRGVIQQVKELFYLKSYFFYNANSMHRSPRVHLFFPFLFHLNYLPRRSLFNEIIISLLPLLAIHLWHMWKVFINLTISIFVNI